MARSAFGGVWRIVGAGFFLLLAILGLSIVLKLLPPERIVLSGKVVDSRGNPLAGVEVVAVPVPVVVVEEPPREASDGRTIKAVTDSGGVYRLRGLAGRCGWKEASYIQPYDITFELAGYRRVMIDFQKPERSEERSFSAPEVVLEEKEARGAAGL